MLYLNPGFDIEGIKAALEATLAAHPLLSASFMQSDGEIIESYGKMKALDGILLEETLPKARKKPGLMSEQIACNKV